MEGILVNSKAGTTSVLRKIVLRERPTNFLDAREFLKCLYQAMKSEMKGYSYRQFAEDLGFGHTNYLHLIVTGQRPISIKAASRMVESMELRAVDRDYFKTLVEYSRAREAHKREEFFGKLVKLKRTALPATLDRDMLEYLSEWHHAVIREMVLLPDFNADPAWISAKLHPFISLEQAEQSLELLKKIGYVELDEVSGRYIIKETNLWTGPFVLSMAVTRYHQKMIEISLDSLTRVPEEQRDYSAATIAISEVDFLDIKTRLQAFGREILEKSAECKNPDRICQVNMQLFTLTKQ
jgi:uncharacterized protein (TIGR02147 family)